MACLALMVVLDFSIRLPLCSVDIYGLYSLLDLHDLSGLHGQFDLLDIFGFYSLLSFDVWLAFLV